MDCRPGCGACCIAPSISSPLPGMPRGKAAGERCVNLDASGRCALWGKAEYPDVCRNFRPAPDVCGTDAASALALIAALEAATSPSK
jgi:Fe-S-cluster containining protein